MLNPLVTVAIPTYNGAHRIASSIESVMNQDYQNIEILICDNASTDNTIEVINEYKQRDTRIRHHRHEKNMGIIYNFNCIAELAKGEYVIRFADDDLMPIDYVGNLVKCVKNKADYQIYSSNVALIKESKDKIIKNYDRSELNFNQLHDKYYLLKQVGNRGVSWSIIYGLTSKEFLKKIPFVEDVEDPGTFYVYQTILRGHIKFTNTTTMYKKEGGLSSSIKKITFSNIKKIWTDTIKLRNHMQTENSLIEDSHLRIRIRLQSYIIIYKYLVKISGYYLINIIVPAEKLRNILNQIKVLN